MQGTILKEIKALIDEYTKNNRKSPTAIYLTLVDENDFLRVPRDEIGDELFGKITALGPQNAIQQLCGIKVVWNAENRRVE